MGGASVRPNPSVSGLKAMGGAVARIYAEGGILAFWTGNGLSVMKIFPESAIKFMTYETAVRPLHVPCPARSTQHSGTETRICQILGPRRRFSRYKWQ